MPEQLPLPLEETSPEGEWWPGPYLVEAAIAASYHPGQIGSLRRYLERRHHDLQRGRS
jgi:hypothetical protein